MSRRKKTGRRIVNTWKTMVRIGTMVVLVLTLSQCSTGMRGGKVPPPTLSHGWSQERTEVLNGKKTAVKCMTLDDIRKINIWTELMKANQEVGR